MADAPAAHPADDAAPAATSLPAMRFRAAAAPEALRGLREDLARFLAAAGVGEATGFAVKLAVNEAANNVLQHAYREHPAPGPLAVEARCRDGRVVVTITDDGAGPAPRSDSPGAGLGMPLMATLADDLVIRHGDDGGTHVELAFDC